MIVRGIQSAGDLNAADPGRRRPAPASARARYPRACPSERRSLTSRAADSAVARCRRASKRCILINAALTLTRRKHSRCGPFLFSCAVTKTCRRVGTQRSQQRRQCARRECGTEIKQRFAQSAEATTTGRDPAPARLDRRRGEPHSRGRGSGDCSCGRPGNRRSGPLRHAGHDRRACVHLSSHQAGLPGVRYTSSPEFATLCTARIVGQITARACSCRQMVRRRTVREAVSAGLVEGLRIFCAGRALTPYGGIFDAFTRANCRTTVT